MKDFIVHTCRSSDGTTLGYRQIGRGPGVIIYHGAGRISQNYERLARALCDSFTVFIPDRRGRGLSGPSSKQDGIREACDDLVSLLRATSADFIFGHSIGGLIALETILANPVRKLAIYEPPLSIRGSVPSAWLAAFEAALAQRKPKTAMAVFLKGTRAHPSMEHMPEWVLRMIVTLLTTLELKKSRGTRMLDLLPTVPQDMHIVMELESSAERYANVTTPTLLMSGSNSQDYYQHAVQVLQTTIPECHLKIYPGFDHFSPEEKTIELAKDLKAYFLRSNRE